MFILVISLIFFITVNISFHAIENKKSRGNQNFSRHQKLPGKLNIFVKTVTSETKA
jgi:hypothetical protein